MKILIQPDKMLKRIRKTPFRPFRLHLSDGRSFDIHYPQMILVTKLRLVVGIPRRHNPDPMIADHFERVDWPEITKIEPLASKSA